MRYELSTWTLVGSTVATERSKISRGNNDQDKEENLLYEAFYQAFYRPNSNRP